MKSDSSVMPEGAATGSSRLMTRLIEAWLPRAASGHLRINLPNGDGLDLGKRESGSDAIMTVHRWRALWRIFIYGEAGFSDGYIAGDWSTGNLVEILDFLMRNEAAFARAADSRLARIFGLLRHRTNENTRAGSRRNIAAHYDLGNEFYRHWLDRGMNYSSAIYEPDLSLEAAQQNKLERISGHLDLKGGERVLEIGCGWGALAEHLVRRFGSIVTGVTLSQAQLDYAHGRLAAEIADGKATIVLQDYRDIVGHFDRIVSIEMFEAVGERYWPAYFEKLRASLVEGGIAILQIITIAPSRFQTYRKHPDFIQRYIFPGGMLPTAGIIEDCAERALLKVTGRESFGASYARTLRDWRHRFLGAWQDIEPMGFDTRFRRMWEYYLAYCETGFLHNAINVSLFRLTR